MEQSNIWIITLVALGIGALIGFLLGRAGSNNSNREQELTEALDKARTELDDYKRKVSTHFEETAELVNGLSDQYRKVYHHLASSAESLCPGLPASAALQQQEQQQLAQDIPTVTDVVDNDEQDEVPEPPRDYAPKKPDETGTLSEEYGLKEAPKADEEAGAAPAATTDPTAYADEADADKPRETEARKPQ